MFSLPSQSCANLQLGLSNYSPIEFPNTCTTHNAKRWRQTGKHGYSKYTAEILLEILQKKAIHPLYNCRTPGFYGSLFLYTTRLMTTSDRSQCPDLISNYEFNDHCPRVNFVYYVNKYLLVPSFKLEAAEIIRNSVTKDAFFYVPIHSFLNIYFSLMYTGKPITSKH